jgi:hypothetical protein
VCLGSVVVAALIGCGGPGPGSESSGSSALFRQVPGSCDDSPLPVAAARASATQSPSFAAAFAVDGNDDTRWSSGPAATAWLQLDLGKREMIRSMSIEWERAFSPLFWVQASDNAVNWATIDIASATQAGFQDLGELDTTARYVRILSQRPSSFGNVSIKEVDVFGDPSTACITVPISSCGAPAFLVPASARASSQQFSYTPASAAIDGVYSTRWSSNFTDNEWLAVDLGGVARIDDVTITWEHAFARKYALQTGPTFSGPWTTAVEVDDGAFGTTLVPMGVTARYLRLLGIQRATQYGYSVWELDVDGSRATTCP